MNINTFSTFLCSAYVIIAALGSIPGFNQHLTENGAIFLPLIIKSGSDDSNVIVNGNFESGQTGWIEYEDSVFYDYQLIVQEFPLSIHPYNGDWAVWLGGDSELLTYIEQQVTIPLSDPELIYWYWIDSIWECDTSHAGVTLNGTFVDQHALCTANDTGGWVKRAVNLTAYAGQTVAVRILSQTGVENYSSFYVDAVSLDSSP
jgi:hypothetical protein